jgi:hypothetical protein
VLAEFSAQQVTLGVLEHLERRRPAIVGDEEKVRAEVQAALEPVRASFREAELPPAYLGALEHEVTACVPALWREAAARFTTLEQRDFGLWRGGDPVARITYVFAGLLVGALCVEAPFIPIWGEWFPFVLAVAAWWLPTAQRAFHRRRYARELGDIALRLGRAQPQLDAHFTNELLLPRSEHE